MMKSLKDTDIMLDAKAEREALKGTGHQLHMTEGQHTS